MSRPAVVACDTRVISVAGAAYAAMMVASPPAHADVLIGPIIISLLTAAGINASAVIIGSLTVGALVSGIATLAIGIGLALLLAPKPPKPENSRQPFQQNVPPVFYGFGRTRIAGATVLKEATSGTLHVVNALAGHEVIGFVSFYLNDDKLEVDSTGHITTYIDGRYGSDVVKIYSRKGASLETAYSSLVSALPDVWTSDHRGDGVASLYMVALPVKAKNFSDYYPYGQPQPSAEVDMCRVFDPRVSGQKWDDPSTWTTSGYDNPILCLLFFECFSPYGARRDYEIAILPVLSQWRDEANICDEEVAIKTGGTERRYRMGGWTTTEQTDVRGTRQQILSSCDGFFVERGDGSIRVWAGKYRAPVITITDDDLVGYTWDSDKPDSDRFEMMTAKYCSPANGYTSVDTDPVQLENGEGTNNQYRTASIDLPWVQSTGQASRLLRREVSRYNEPLRGEIVTRLSGLNAIYERWVYLDTSIPRLDGVVVENKGPSISIAEGVVRMKFQSSGPSVDTYTPATDESSPPITVIRPSDEPPPTPVITAATAETITLSGSTVVVYISVTIEQPTFASGDPRDDLTYGLRWALDAVTPIWESNTSDPAAVGGYVEILSDPVSPNTTYYVEAATIANTGVYSPWTTAVAVSTSVAGTAPASPSITSATGGAGSATIVAKAPNSPNVYAIRVWRGASGSSFATSTDVSGALYCSANQAITYTNTGVAAGTWKYWVTAENSSGTLSSAAGPSTVTVT